MGPERSGRWPGNWGCTGERCGRRWPARCRRSAKIPERERPKLAAAIPFIDAILEARPQGAQKAAAHGAPDMDATAPRETGSRGSGIDGSPVCARQEGCHGPAGAGNVRAAVLSVRWRGAGGLVRRLGRVRRRGPQDVRVLLAQHGQRRRLSPGLSARHPASVSGSARAGVCLFWRRVPCFALRQPEERREENPARPSTGGNRAVHRFPLALGIRIGVLYARRGTRERRRGGRRGPVPAELSGAGAERAAPGGVEPAAGGGVARGAESRDRGPRANRSARG